MTNQYLDNFISDVRLERQYQQSKWGDEFDKKNTANDWVSYIAGYLGKAVTMPWNAETFRTALVKVATLCAAAAEWCDRTNGNLPKRHYD